MHPVTLCVTFQKRNAERPWRHSHAGAWERSITCGEGACFRWAVVGAAEGCDLLIWIFRLILNWLWKDRSLALLDSSYGAAEREQAPSPR